MDFSIVTVSLNMGGTIGHTLESVLRQKGVQAESIVIDGGSTDNTRAVVQSFGSGISYFVSEPDGGHYEAMNKGLARARGRIVAFLNADDYYADDGVLADVHRAFVASNATVVAGTVLLVRPDGRLVRTITPTPRKLTKLLWGVAPPHPATFYKTALVRAVKGYDPSFNYSGDFELFARLSKSPDYRIRIIDRTLACARTGGGSTRGKFIYFRMSPELKRALVQNRIGGVPWRVNFRAIWKLPEVALPALNRRRAT
jgi:glycosyltransferase involved in cell wall biosynthesis